MAARYLQKGLLTLLWASSVLAAGGSLPWLSPVYPLYSQPLAFGSEIEPK